MRAMKKYICELVGTWKNLFTTLLKWMALSILIGGIIGGIASAFSYAVTWATGFRQMHPMIILGMPLGGLVIVSM